MTAQALARPDGAHERPFPFQVGAPVEHRGIVVAPLFPLRDPVARYLALDVALERGLEITGAGADGRVPELAVSNPLADDVLLYGGEKLVGAEQERILSASVLVAGGATLVVPVSCVAHEPAIRALEGAFAAEPGQCGAVLGIGDTLRLDVVSRPDAFACLWPKLRKGYLLDALECLDCRPTRPERLLGFVDEVAEAPVRRWEAVGRGVALRREGPGIRATGLALDGELLQLSAVTVEPGPGRDGPGEPPGRRPTARPSRRRS